MTRFKFFVAVLGAVGLAKGQDTNGSISTRMRIEDTPSWKTGNAKNGQCPACGTQAPPYVPVTTFCGDYSSGQPKGWVMGLAGCQSTSTLTFCQRCNAAFKQDAEAK